MRLRTLHVLFLSLAISFVWAALPNHAVAQEEEPTKEENEKPKKKDELPAISDKTEGMTKREGFITLWVDEKKDELYAQIPNSLLGKDFLLATSLSAGPYRGYQWSELLVRLERYNKELMVIQPNTFYEAKGELERVVQETYPDQVLTTQPIMAENGNSVLIDLKNLLGSKSSAFGITVSSGAKVTQVSRAKAFPDNAVVEIRYRGPRGGSGIYYSLGRLPETGYKPRTGDQRVGYFLTARVDFGKDPRADTTFDRYIHRWNVQKADPDERLSPPKEPIVFYIEDTVPVRYRRWVKQGFEMWNDAFEEVGIVDAIVVRQQTKTNEFADLDPEDARYNFFRWIASGRSFAMGPSRVNPRTGEILDADIIFDESMVRYYIRDFDLFVNSVPVTENWSQKLRHWLARNPQEHPGWPELAYLYSLRVQNDPLVNAATPEQAFARDILAYDNLGYNHNYCSLGQHMSTELAFANLSYEMLAYSEQAKGEEADDGDNGNGDDDDGENGDEAEEEEAKDLLSEWPEEFIGPLIREIVAHEVGHTLGLRHNFKASTWKSFESIVEPSDPEAPTVGSVMDYNPFTLKGDGTQPSVWITPAIGPYDYWAIEYGYAIPGSDGYAKNEAKMLREITQRVAEEGLAYGTDEDLFSPDPEIESWDLGSDPLEFHQARIDLSEKITSDLLEFVIDDDESYEKARRAYHTLLVQRYYAAMQAARYIGGYHLSRAYKGDPNAGPPIRPVSAQQQRKAMKLIVDSLLAKDAITVDPDLQNHLAASRWRHRGSDIEFLPLIYPIQDQILLLQRYVLFELMNPERVQYIYDAEFHVGEDEELYALPDFLSDLTEAIWQEALEGEPKGSFSVRKPLISNLRRNLQRYYLGRLIEIANSGESSEYPAVVRTLAWKEMKDLGEGIGELLDEVNPAKLDSYTLAHLEESKARIDNALEAQYTVGGGGGSAVLLIYGSEVPGAEGAATSDPWSPWTPSIPSQPYMGQ